MPDMDAGPQTRPACYSEAVAFVRGQARVRLAELAARLAVEPDTADVFLSCMQAEGVIGARALNGWWPVLALPESAPEPTPEPPAESAPIEPQLAALDAALDRLHRAAQAARWKAEAAQRRALAAEQRLVELENRPRPAPAMAEDGRLAAVKRLLARELHPDQPGSAAERGLREALFKRLWPKLEAIERGALR